MKRSSVWVVEFNVGSGWKPNPARVFEKLIDAESKMLECNSCFPQTKYRVRRYDRVPDRARRKR